MYVSDLKEGSTLIRLNNFCVVIEKNPKYISHSLSLLFCCKARCTFEIGPINKPLSSQCAKTLFGKCTPPSDSFVLRYADGNAAIEGTLHMLSWESFTAELGIYINIEMFLKIFLYIYKDEKLT